ncbi:hypothetical protein R6Z07M_009490 [Ovis aries]
MSDSVRPQRRQPTRLPRPWDSPGSLELPRCPVVFPAQFPRLGKETKSVEEAAGAIWRGYQCSDSPDGRALTGLIGGMDQLTRNSHRISYGPRARPQSGPTPTG